MTDSQSCHQINEVLKNFNYGQAQQNMALNARVVLNKIFVLGAYDNDKERGNLVFKLNMREHLSFSPFEDLMDKVPDLNSVSFNRDALFDQRFGVIPSPHDGDGHWRMFMMNKENDRETWDAQVKVYESMLKEKGGEPFLVSQFNSARMSCLMFVSCDVIVKLTMMSCEHHVQTQD
jgi:hypothetical protein